MITVVDKHLPRDYSAITTSNGIVLCDRMEGAFLVLRFPEDIERLRALLDTLIVQSQSTSIESK